MEGSKHSHRRKKSHNHHQNTKKLAGSVKLEVQEPVFGKEIESGRDSELRKYAQNVLGRYDDYRSAVSKMSNMNEQMYGVAELTPASKPQPAGEGRTGKAVPIPDLKKERLRKKHHGDFKLVGGSGQIGRSVSADVAGGKKKASVPPYIGSYPTTSTEASNHFPLEKKHSASLFASGTQSKLPSSTAASDIYASADHSVTQTTHQAMFSTSTPTLAAKEKRKAKKTKRRRSSHVYESPTSIAPLDPEHLPSKTRPEALSLSMDNMSCTPTDSDVPDTGDVRHMLQELLHPQSVSLVTPIPTPNKIKPFVFPSHHVFKAPNSSEMAHSDSFHKPSTCDRESSTCYKKPVTMVSSDMSIDHAGQWVQSSSSSGSSSSSSSSSCSSSASSRSSSPSSVTTTSSREHSPVELEDDKYSLTEVYHHPDRDGGPRLTLERLQQQIAASNMAAITPLKKTPPHLSGREELANLSPAKSHKPTVLTQNDPTLSSLASQSSLGFHPLPTQLLTNDSAQSNDADSNEYSDSSSESSEAPSQGHLYVTSGVVSNAERLSHHLPVQHQQFVTAQEQQNLLLSKSHRKKKRNHHPDFASIQKKHKMGTHLYSSKQSSSQESNLSRNQNEGTESATEVPQSSVIDTPSSLLVKIPLVDLRVPKPKATVEPYNIRVTATTSTTPHRRNTGDTITEPEEVGQGRDRYSRLQNVDYSTGLDFHGGSNREERGRIHTGSRWERESTRTANSRLSGRAHGWEREHYHRGGEDYWSDASHYESSRESQRGGATGGRNFQRKRDPENFMQEARRRKKEADKIMVPGLEKAKLYMESVTYFMRHGGAIENEQQSGGANQAVKKNPYKMYSDTVSMIKYCQNMAGECKPLLVLCLRCQSALYWRMFLIKQLNTAHVCKELQEYFVPPKGGQSKSPFLGGLSPLPSPASVGSTASTSSAGGSGTTASHLADSTVALPRHIYNKTTEHLTVSALVYTCLELWRLSDSYMQQCREFFLNADRKAGLTIHYYSPVFQVASWVENILKSF